MKRTRLRRKRPLRKTALAFLKRGIADARAGRLKSLGSFARKKPMRKRNPKRHTKEWLRAYGSEERVEWIKAQPCAIGFAAPSENAHVRTGGMGRKADAKWIVPLCRRCHRSLHVTGKKAFEQTHAIDLDQAARRTHCRWQAYLEWQAYLQQQG